MLSDTLGNRRYVFIDDNRLTSAAIVMDGRSARRSKVQHCI